MNNIYGYIRVSSVDQNEARQLAAMQRLRVHEKHIYLDKQSGKDFERPNYQKLIGKMQQGILAAKAKGVRFGRPEASIPKNFNKLVRQWRQDELPLKEVLSQCRISRATFYRRLRDLEAAE